MRLVAWWPAPRWSGDACAGHPWRQPKPSRLQQVFQVTSDSENSKWSGNLSISGRGSVTPIPKNQLKLVSNSGADMMPKLARHLLFSACFKDCRLVLVGQKGRRVLQNLLLYSLEVPDVWGCVSWKLRLDRIGWPWFLMVRLFPADRSSWGLGIVPNWTCCNGTLVDLGVLAASA